MLFRSMFELVTGYQIFDSLMGGVPKEGALVTLPGKPFHGKSILIDNFIVNMLRLNPSNTQTMSGLGWAGAVPQR